MDAIRKEVRGSPVIKVDETGLKVGGRNRWLHVFVSDQAVLYDLGGRGREVAKSVSGHDYSGTLIHDGLEPYDGFESARHQKCVFQLLKRCRQLLEKATRGAVRFPRAVESLLREGLALRHRFEQREVSCHGLNVMAGRLTRRMKRLALPPKVNIDNERFAMFLWKHADEVFKFLR